jgi:O-antigen/teichoic acid export membrane protein
MHQIATPFGTVQTYMQSVTPLRTEETEGETTPAPKTVPPISARLHSAVAAIPSVSRLMPVVYSFADQALAVGGLFLANVVLARTGTKEEYGTFVLSYSVFTFLSGVHNAMILEPYTVFGSGRYRDRHSAYLRLMVRSNAVGGLLLTGLLLAVCLLLRWVAPQLAFRALVGLGLTVGVLLSGTFLRRVFYVQRQAALAAKASLLFFLTVACGLWLTARVHVLNSFSVFLILALGWITAGTGFGAKLDFGKPTQQFLSREPGYWREHWKYSRWVLATAFVFQLTTQGYYWLVAAFLSVKEVGELRATYLLVAPVEQVLVAVSFILLPALASHYAANRMRSYLSLWTKYVMATVAVTCLFALGILFLGKPVMHVLYAGKFDGLAPLLNLLALMPLLIGIGATIANALNAAERPKLVLYAYISGGGATILFGIPLVTHFGLHGAVYGMLLSGATYTGALAVGFLLSVYSKARRNMTLAGPDGAAQTSKAFRAPRSSTWRDTTVPTRLAPIALFVYNRADHTRRTLEALRNNVLAKRSDLFVFSDGPKNEGAIAAIEDVRRIVGGIEGFRAVHLIEQERNLGLSNSIIQGVTRLCQDFGRAIAIEDDLLTTPDFLSFTNAALDRYSDIPEVFSVCGFNYPIVVPRLYLYDAFFSHRFACWGWGTWQDRWEKADWAVSDFSEFIASRERQQRFNLGGDDLAPMLARHMAGKIDSWDTVWAYAHSKHGAAALLPVVSKTYNVGLDGSGIHCRRAPFVQTPLRSESSSEYSFPDSVEFDPRLVAEIQRVCHRSLARRSVRFFSDKLGIR